jgi:hypothetical protein
MVDVPGSLYPTPLRGATVDVFYIDGGHYRISISTRHRHFLALVVGAPDLWLRHPPGDPPLTFLSVDAERSQIYSSVTSQGGPPSMFFSVDGGRSWISVSTRQGAHRRYFLVLMVGTPRSPAPAPPKGPAR